MFEGLLNKSIEELTEEEIEILAQIYAEAYGKLSGTENEQESAEIVICFTENLFELTEETDGIAEHYYVKSKNELIRAIEEKIDKEQELAIYSLENLWGTRIQLNWLWYESDWSEFTTDIPELKDFQENSELMSVVLVKTDLGIQTILYASPYAGNRENYADKGYKVIYEKELYDLPLVERCIRTGYVMTMEEEKQIEKEVKEYFSKDENKLAMDMALTFGIDNITQSTKVNYTEAEMEEFRKMYYLYWKTNDAEAIRYGFCSNFILTSPLEYGGLVDHLTGYREDGSHMREYLNVAIEQNKFSYTAGGITGGLLSYKAGASIMKKIPGVGKVFTKAGEKLSKLPIIGKLGAESLTDILADTTLDTAIDTIPCMVEMALEGESGGEIVKEGIKQTVSNIGTNVACEAVFKIGKGVAKGIKKGGQEVVEEGAEAAIKGGSVPKTGVGNTDISIENFTAKDVPTVKNGEFNEFFNSLSVDELDALWSKPEIRDVIEARLRSPGGLHEWHLVSRTPQFKYWDISAEQIKDLRTLTSEVEFVNPSGVHGGRGSTAAHNELLKIIDTSNDYDTFVRRLNNWANYRLKGGVEALPEGLQIK